MRIWTGNYRARNHDYAAPAIYHITLAKREEAPIFSNIIGSSDIPTGRRGCAKVNYTPVGKSIASALQQWSAMHYPDILIWQYVIMPDHIHLLTRVCNLLDVPIGNKLAILKVLAKKACGLKNIFLSGFNDRIILPGEDLNPIYNYIRDNPRRYAVRQQHSDYFRRQREIRIGTHVYNAYGNLQLLESPYKQQVVIHRADTPSIRATHRAKWLRCAANGGILISPFISRDEKTIRNEVEALGGRIILISDNNFGDRGKPTGHNFELCEEGRLLILSPLEHDFPAIFGRESCLQMDARAAEIAAQGPELRI